MEKSNEVMLYNYHTHTTFCDGDNTAEDMIDYFKKGGKKLIFSSDCHNKVYLLCGYEEVKKYL